MAKIDRWPFGQLAEPRVHGFGPGHLEQRANRLRLDGQALGDQVLVRPERSQAQGEEMCPRQPVFRERSAHQPTVRPDGTSVVRSRY